MSAVARTSASRALLRRTSLSARLFATSASRSALSATALPHAEKLSAEWKGTSMTGGKTKNFIGGEFAESQASEWIDVVDPVRGLPRHVVSATDLPRLSPVYPDAAFARPANYPNRVRAGCRCCVRGLQDLEPDQRSQAAELCPQVCEDYIRHDHATDTPFPTSPRLQQLLRENADAIANSIVLEQGKTLPDAHGDLLRGLQVVETAAAATTTLMGNILEGGVASISCCL